MSIIDETSCDLHVIHCSVNDVFVVFEPASVRG